MNLKRYYSMLGITFLFNIFFVLHFVTSFHQNESFMEKHKKNVMFKKWILGSFLQESRFYGYCLNVSPNSYGAHGVHTNATHFGRFGRVFEVCGYTIFTLVWN
jgi:hypothetical protein